MAGKLFATRNDKWPTNIDKRRAIRQLIRWLDSVLDSSPILSSEVPTDEPTLERQLRELATTDPVVKELGWKIAPAAKTWGPRHYEDFVIEFTAGPEDEYITSSRALGHEASGRFRLPWQLGRLPEVLEQIARTVTVGAEDGVRHARAAPEEGTPAAIDLEDEGKRLFETLFEGDLGRHYDRSLATVSVRDVSSGLRLKLCLDLAKPSHRILDQLPWELLWDRTPLGLDEESPISRYLGLSRSGSPVHAPGPLRILLVQSAALGEKLDFEDENRRIEDAWAALNSLQLDLDVLQEPSVTTIARRLREKPYDVLHFMGHGSVDELEGHGCLHLSDIELEEKEISGRLLVDILRQQRSLRLIVLNVCQSGGFDALLGATKSGLGVAQEVVKTGCPAVVAMRFKISDRAAICFAEGFYRALADGLPVDVAVIRGRQEIRFKDECSWEWATPVVYLRSFDGYLFGR